MLFLIITNSMLICLFVTSIPRGSWWRHLMVTFSALLAICARNSPVPGEFPAQRPVTRSFDVFFYLRLNKRLSKQSSAWWFDTLSRPLWRHRIASFCTNGSDLTINYAENVEVNLWPLGFGIEQNIDFRMPIASLQVSPGGHGNCHLPHDFDSSNCAKTHSDTLYWSKLTITFISANNAWLPTDTPQSEFIWYEIFHNLFICHVSIH